MAALSDVRLSRKFSQLLKGDSQAWHSARSEIWNYGKQYEMQANYTCTIKMDCTYYSRCHGYR